MEVIKMGFVFRMGGGTGSSSADIIMSVNPPLDTSKFWLDLSSGKPVFRKYNINTATWDIAEGDINDSNVASTQTWSSQQIVDNSGYIHIQEEASSVWVINHSLNRMPSVYSADDLNEEIIGEVSYESLSRVVIVFSEPVSGKAYLS